MNYGYIRVSTDTQTVENQRFEIQRFAAKLDIAVDGWIEETASGGKEYKKRALGPLLKKVQEGDLIICSELSRLGRTLFMIMDILNLCMTRGVKVWTIKDNYRLGDDISSKVLAFAFGLSAEIERNLISQRTKEALALRRAQGVILGRPRGKLNASVKCTGHEDDIAHWLAQGWSKSKIARKLKVHKYTLLRFMTDRMGLQHGQPFMHVQCGEKNHLAKFSNAEAAVIRRRYAEDRVPVRVLAREIGASEATISKIVNGRSYKQTPFLA